MVLHQQRIIAARRFMFEAWISDVVNGRARIGDG